MGTDPKMIHQCHYTDCDSGARWSVHLHIECQAPGKKHLLAFATTIECCDEHQAKVKAYVLSDENREKLSDLLMDNGYPEPNYLTARIEFRPVSREPVIAAENCNRGDCSEIARWRIVQAIPHVAKIGEVVRLPTNLCVCDRHKDETKPSDLLDPQSRAITHKALRERGLGLRSLNRMRLEFEALRGG